MSKKADEEEESSRVIQSLHLALKPNSVRSSRMYSHDTVSKARAISNLINRAAFFLRCRDRTQFWTYKKLSCRHLDFRKALWAGEIRESMTDERRRERTFAMSFGI